MKRWHTFLAVAVLLGSLAGTAPGQTPYKRPPAESGQRSQEL
jgi:hypothetical protein